MKNRVIRNLRSRRLVILLAVALIAINIFSPIALVQTGRPPTQPGQLPNPRPGSIQNPTATLTRQPVKINPRVLRTITRAPIAFQPLKMVDPRTSQPVTPEKMIALENGKQISAAQFYDQMNKLEAGLNKQGYSFRDPEKEVILNEVVLDKEKVRTQIKSMRFTAPNPKTVAQLDTIAQNHRAYVREVNPYFGKLPPKGTTARVNRGLYGQRVGGLIVKPGSTATPIAPSSSSNLPKKRPDFVPGDSAVTGLGSDVERLPGVNLNPGTTPAGQRASAIQINAAWSNVAFYVNYLNTATAPLAPRYVWQVTKATASFDNFGAFGKAWPKEFNDDEVMNWKTPPSLMTSGNVSFLKQGSGPSNREHLFQVDFSKFAGNPPAGKPVFYLVRVVPVNADGSIAGYPSRPVIVSYGAELPPTITLPKPAPVALAKFPVNNLAQEAPNSFGDPAVMSLNLNTWMKSNGTQTQESASVGFDAGCSVFGQQFSLLKITAGGEVSVGQVGNEGQVAVKGQVHGKISYLVLGIELPCEKCEDTNASGVSFQSDYTKAIDEGFTFGFPIGPIDVSGTIGFRGAVGFGGHVGLSTVGVGNQIFISAGPHVSAHVFLEGGVGIGLGGFDVVTIGVGGEVNLITAGFVVGLKIGVDGNQYFGRVSELKALNGQLYGFAKAGICPFCKKWEIKLFDWGGYDMLASDPGHATLFEGNL